MCETLYDQNLACPDSVLHVLHGHRWGLNFSAAMCRIFGVVVGFYFTFASDLVSNSRYSLTWTTEHCQCVFHGETRATVGPADWMPLDSDLGQLSMNVEFGLNAFIDSLVVFNQGT